MIRCSKCKKSQTETEILAWRCNHCNKVYRLSLTDIRFILSKKEKIDRKRIIKCSNCGYVLDDGKELIVWRCSCGFPNKSELSNYRGNKNEYRESKTLNKFTINRLNILIIIFVSVVLSSLSFVAYYYGENQIAEYKTAVMERRRQIIEEEKEKKEQERLNEIERIKSNAEDLLGEEEYEAAILEYDKLEKLQYDATEEIVRTLEMQVNNLIEMREYDDALSAVNETVINNYDASELLISIYESKAVYLYETAEFNEVEECYDLIDELGGDTSVKRELLEYDIENFDIAYDFYLAIYNADKELRSNSYGSLRSLVSSLAKYTKSIDKAEINKDSLIGKYINDIRNNNMYQFLKDEYIYDDSIYIDHYLTKYGYKVIIQGCTEQILKTKFPYKVN